MLVIEPVLDSGSLRDKWLEHVDDQGPMGGVVAVGDVSGFVVEISDDDEIPVRVRESGVRSESVVTYGRDLAAERGQRVRDRMLGGIGRLGGPLEHDDMAKHGRTVPPRSRALPPGDSRTGRATRVPRWGLGSKRLDPGAETPYFTLFTCEIGVTLGDECRHHELDLTAT